jgi:hypothetical protein
MTATRHGSIAAEEAQAPLHPGRIMELGLGFWGSKALLSAVELIRTRSRGLW